MALLSNVYTYFLITLLLCKFMRGIKSLLLVSLSSITVWRKSSYYTKIIQTNVSKHSHNWAKYQCDQQMFLLQPIQQTRSHVKRCDVIDHTKNQMFSFFCIQRNSQSDDCASCCIGTIILIIIHISINT